MANARSSSRPRDDGAPDTVDAGATGDPALDPTVPLEQVDPAGDPTEGPVAAPHTIPPGGPALEDVQRGITDAGVVRTSLPIGDDQVTSDPGALTGYTGSPGVPASAPFSAPSGSTWTDEADRTLPSQYNETDGGPRLAYVVTWAQAAVHVDVAAAQTRTVGEGEEQREERFVTVQSATGTREAVLDGQQVTLNRGEVLPGEAVEGQGAFLANIGGAVPVSVPPA